MPTTHLRVVDVVHFVENNKLDVSDQVGTLVEHAPEDLRSHLEARSSATNPDRQQRCDWNGYRDGGGRGARTMRQLPSALICTSPVRIPTVEGSKVVLKSLNF
jgi:hypothetical protein